VPAVATQPLLALEGIGKRFGPVQALSDVELEVHQGEVLALVGDNGAGKSTLVKTVAGVHAPDVGRIRFEGREVKLSSPQDAAALGISTVYQDLALCDNLDVVANLYLGRELLRAPLAGRLRRLTEPEMEAQAGETLAGLSVRLPGLRRPVAALSGGQRQSVAVARAVLWGSRVVLLDEPTAALGVEQTDGVLKLIRRLAERGLAVVVISHNLSDVFRVADRIAVLRLGRNAGTFVAADTEPDAVVSAITGGRTLTGSVAR
jgi:D-xylose transport system ATP-binding protein